MAVNRLTVTEKGTATETGQKKPIGKRLQSSCGTVIRSRPTFYILFRRLYGHYKSIGTL